MGTFHIQTAAVAEVGGGPGGPGLSPLPPEQIGVVGMHYIFLAQNQLLTTGEKTRFSPTLLQPKLTLPFQ